MYSKVFWSSCVSAVFAATKSQRATVTFFLLSAFYPTASFRQSFYYYSKLSTADKKKSRLLTRLPSSIRRDLESRELSLLVVIRLGLGKLLINLSQVSGQTD